MMYLIEEYSLWSSSGYAHILYHFSRACYWHTIFGAVTGKPSHGYARRIVSKPVVKIKVVVAITETAL